MLVSMHGLNGDDVELEKLDGVGGAIIMRADVRLELVKPDHIALLASKSKTPRVVDRVPGDLDVLASLADVVDGAVMIFAVALEGDACVFRSALDNLAARLPARRRCGGGYHLLGLSGLPISGTWGMVPRRRIWISRALGSSQGRVFVGDGKELGDSSTPPLTPVRSGLIAQQLLRHGESLRRGQLTPRTSARSSGGGEGERRLYMPGQEVGGLQIFLLFLLGRDVLATEDGLSLSSNDVAVAKTLEPCVGVGHIKADLEENTPQPPTWRAKCRWISCRKNTGYHTTDPKIRTQGAVHVRSWIATKHGDGSLEMSERTAHCRERHRALPMFRALVVR
jgi:hypothetical protein